MEYNDSRLNTIVGKIGGDTGALMFLKDSTSVSEFFPDFIVQIDRLVKPTYPDWIKELVHPELELLGPAEYDLQAGVRQWLHDDQNRGYVRGGVIYKYLKDTNTLGSCLSLQDGLVIQQKGVEIFRELFKGKKVFLWKSVVQLHHDNYLLVPFLREEGGELVVHWRWLDDRWNLNDPALRFSK
ncbi:hypothetical protein A3B84_01615 [Candidatus Nomurabacteria bacterium RIFCSPHIGHO2_02_FULL_35_13]|uniref:Uncharacterized protein n=2 Tax=Candidatus Nomuraibacteriota TaxID=1752729 RepID=A0A1F6VNR6_9BACT|nr:MAG: hypothetical protein UR88_C0001G0027 [Candidatus Nomurabacteria bacterium GW2011_GWA1_35_8]OGI71209.1 MAG: hypothetical protein A3B84_01615 [Candidatus Nomurabacteria bacterium RIFCSPHIGHO2_02_FULL_35_13]